MPKRWAHPVAESRTFHTLSKNHASDLCPTILELRRVADAAFWPLAQAGTRKSILRCPRGGAGIWRCPWCIISHRSSGHRGRWTTKTVGTLGQHPALAQGIVEECLLCTQEALGSTLTLSMFFCLSRLLPVGCGAGRAPQTPAKITGAACVAGPGGGEGAAVVHSGLPHKFCPASGCSDWRGTRGNPRELCTSREKQDRL